MPPEIRSESDNESDEDVIQPKKSVKKQPAKAVNADSDAEEEDAGAESDVSNEYTVEAIMDHKFAGDDGNVSLLSRLHVYALLVCLVLTPRLFGKIAVVLPRQVAGLPQEERLDLGARRPPEVALPAQPPPQNPTNL